MREFVSTQKSERLETKNSFGSVKQDKGFKRLGSDKSVDADMRVFWWIMVSLAAILVIVYYIVLCFTVFDDSEAQKAALRKSA